MYGLGRWATGQLAQPAGSLKTVSQVRDGVALVQISNKEMGIQNAVRKRDDRGAPEVDLETDEVRR